MFCYICYTILPFYPDSRDFHKQYYNYHYSKDGHKPHFVTIKFVQLLFINQLPVLLHVRCKIWMYIWPSDVYVLPMLKIVCNSSQVTHVPWTKNKLLLSGCNIYAFYVMHYGTFAFLWCVIIGSCLDMTAA